MSGPVEDREARTKIRGLVAVAEEARGVTGRLLRLVSELAAKVGSLSVRVSALETRLSEQERRQERRGRAPARKPKGARPRARKRS